MENWIRIKLVWKALQTSVIKDNIALKNKATNAILIEPHRRKMIFLLHRRWWKFKSDKLMMSVSITEENGRGLELTYLLFVYSYMLTLGWNAAPPTWWELSWRCAQWKYTIVAKFSKSTSLANPNSINASYNSQFSSWCWPYIRIQHGEPDPILSVSDFPSSKCFTFRVAT